MARIDRSRASLLTRRARWRPPESVERALAAVVLAYTAFWGWSYAHRDGDFALYLWGGNAVLAESDIYRGGVSTGWPPVFFIPCVPFALLDRIAPWLSRGTWVALNLGLLYACLRMLASLIFKKRLALLPARGALSLGSPAVFIPLLLTGRFLHNNFEFLQVNVAILALTLAGLAWIGRGHDAQGGIAIGAAAALKVLPAAFIPFLFWRHRRHAAAWALASLAFWTVVPPALVFGPARLTTYLREFPAAVREGRGVNGPNQSLYALAERAIVLGIRPGNAWTTSTDYLPPSGDRRAVNAAAAASLLLVAACAWCFRGAPWKPDARGLLEVGAVFAATVLLPPCSWLHYYVALLVPLAVLWARQERLAAGGLAAFAALTMLTSRAVLGTRGANALLALSAPAWGAVILFATLVALRRRAAR